MAKRGLKKVHLLGLTLGHIVNIFHPLVKRFALDGGFVGVVGNVAQELGHLFVDGVWFPIFPADFEVGEECGIMKGEEVIFFDVFW